MTAWQLSRGSLLTLSGILVVGLGIWWITTSNKRLLTPPTMDSTTVRQNAFDRVVSEASRPQRSDILPEDDVEGVIDTGSEVQEVARDAPSIGDPVVAMIEADLASPGSERGCGGLLPAGVLSEEVWNRIMQSERVNPEGKSLTDAEEAALRRLIEPVNNQIESTRLEFKFEYARIKLEIIRTGQFTTDRPELSPETAPPGGNLAGVMSAAGPGLPGCYDMIKYDEQPLLREVSDGAFRLHHERSEILRTYIEEV